MARRRLARPAHPSCPPARPARERPASWAWPGWGRRRPPRRARPLWRARPRRRGRWPRRPRTAWGQVARSSQAGAYPRPGRVPPIRGHCAPAAPVVPGPGVPGRLGSPSRWVHDDAMSASPDFATVGSMRRSPSILIGALALAVAGSGVATAVVTKHAGPRPDGTAVTPVGFRLTPAGHQTKLGDLPLSSALSPDGRKLLVSNDGQGTQSLQLVDVAHHEVEQTLPYSSPESVYMGLAWSPDGRTAYASAAANSKIRVLHYADGKLTEGAPIQLPTTNPDGVKVTLFPAGLATTPDGTHLVVADQLGDAVSVVDLATGTARTVAAGHRPMWVSVSKDGSKAFVSNQGASTVDVVSLTGATPSVTGHIPVGLHPNKSVRSPDGRSLYV